MMKINLDESLYHCLRLVQIAPHLFHISRISESFYMRWHQYLAYQLNNMHLNLLEHKFLFGTITRNL